MPSCSPSPESPPPADQFIPKTDPDDVHLYISPWVSGTRAANYFGSLSSEVEYEGATEVGDAIERALRALQESCSVIGGNAIVGVELTVDPFRTPSLVRVIGTGATLVSLFE